jgi:membrane protein DedA with SNARE-associated domain
MIEAFIGWLAGLPPVAIYGSIAILAAVENIFPPIPADTAIALGAFLAHRGITSPGTVFAVTLVANVASAMAMYFLAARHAPALFRSRIARSLLPEDGMAFVRREYDRFGLVGLFIGRMLPGFRAVVAPFAGLIHLGPLRAGIPIALASAIWYGGLIYAAALLGDRFDEILLVVGNVNRSLGYIALAALVGILFWIRRRRRANRPVPD